MERDSVITLPSGAEIDVASAVGDINRTREFLAERRRDLLEGEEWADVDGLLCDLPNIAELLEWLAARVRIVG